MKIHSHFVSRPWMRAVLSSALLSLTTSPHQALAYGELGTDYVSVMDASYGVYNNGTDPSGDNSDRINQAIADGCTAEKPVFFPPGRYLIDSQLIVGCSGMLLFGQEGSNMYGPKAVIVVASTLPNAQPAIHFQRHMQGLHGIRLEGPGKTSTQVAIKLAQTTANSDDVDATIAEASFYGFGTAVQITGRGLLFESNSVAATTTGVQLMDWPNCGANCVGDEGPVDGFRAFEIRNNRAHNVSTFVLNEGDNAANLKGLVLANNLMDLGDKLFQGGAYQSSFTGNVVTHTKYPAFYFTRPVKNSTISGNVIGGRDGLSGTYTENQPLYGINITADCEHVVISGNTFSNINGSAINFSSSSLISNYIAITGNTFYKTLNEGTNLTNYASIYFTDDAWRVSIVGNTFYMEQLGRTGSLYAIRAPLKLKFSQVQGNTLSTDIAGIVPSTDHSNSSVQP